MEVRKIIKLGDATLCVTLPKFWTEQQGISKGEHVELVAEENGSLTVRRSSSLSQEIKDTVITSLHDIEFAYTQGFTDVTLKGAFSKEDVQTKTSELIATHVTQKGNTFHIKVFVGDQTTSLKDTLNQIDEQLTHLLTTENEGELSKLITLAKRLAHVQKKQSVLSQLSHYSALTTLLALLRTCENHKPTLNLFRTLLSHVTDPNKVSKSIETISQKLPTRPELTQLYGKLILNHVRELAR